MSVPPYLPSSRSPPPLQHPKPTHPAYPPPEPPGTPALSPDSSPYSQPPRISQDGDYVRYSSPPVGAVGNVTPDTSSSSSMNTYGGPGLQNRQTFGGATPVGITGVQGYQSMGNMGSMGTTGMNNMGMGGGMANMGNMGNGGMGFGWGGMNDATAQMGVQFGKSAVAAGQDYVEKNFTRYLPLTLIKTSFAVTNSYVLNKLRLILFPWRHKPWARQVKRLSENGAVDGWQAPRDDINAPDLYIPTMALVTYTLLSALASGLQARFHPEVLGLSFSKALAVVIAEFCAIKLGCYLLDVRGSGASGVELIGYGGYKFVGIIITVLASMLNLGTLTTGAVFIYLFGANAFFLIRSLRYVLLPDTSSGISPSTSHTLSHAQRARRVQFLFIMAVSQILWMGWLSRV